MKRLTYRDNEGGAQRAPELLEDNTGMAGSVIRSFVADVEDILGDDLDLNQLSDAAFPAGTKEKELLSYKED